MHNFFVNQSRLGAWQTVVIRHPGALGFWALGLGKLGIDRR